MNKQKNIILVLGLIVFTFCSLTNANSRYDLNNNFQYDDSLSFENRMSYVNVDYLKCFKGLDFCACQDSFEFPIIQLSNYTQPKVYLLECRHEYRELNLVYAESVETTKKLLLFGSDNKLEKLGKIEVLKEKIFFTDENGVLREYVLLDSLSKVPPNS